MELAGAGTEPLSIASPAFSPCERIASAVFDSASDALSLVVLLAAAS